MTQHKAKIHQRLSHSLWLCAAPYMTNIVQRFSRIPESNMSQTSRSDVSTDAVHFTLIITHPQVDKCTPLSQTHGVLSHALVVSGTFWCQPFDDLSSVLDLGDGGTTPESLSAYHLLSEPIYVSFFNVFNVCSVGMIGWLVGGKEKGEKNLVIRELHSTSTCFFLLMHLCKHDCSSFHLPDKVHSPVVLQHIINCVHYQPRCLYMLPYKQMLHKINTTQVCSEVFLTFLKLSAKTSSS